MPDEIQSEAKVTRQINLPSWTIEAAKIICTVVIAIALVYVRFASVENKVSDHGAALVKIEAKSESTRDALTQTVQKVSTLEVQQTLVSGEFRDSLKRIEDDIKDVKLDLKNSRKP